MTPREERGLVIAALCKLKNNDGEWLVPSQSKGETLYKVNPSKQTCTCPDHAESGHKCKHLFAVEIVMKREVATDGTVTETKSITFTEKKVYKQNWPAYNMAQTTEKKRFQVLLHDLCQTVEEPKRGLRRGRRPHTLRDMLFSVVYKTYCGFSSRRFNSDLLEAFEKGFVSHPITGMKVPQFQDNETLLPILTELIARSAKPLAAVEKDFAVDSSGFSSSRFERWFDEKYGVTKRAASWVKCHIVCGVKTNIITAVRILEKESGDSPQLKPLVAETAKSFQIVELSADKAYLSQENFQAVSDAGGTFFPMFKVNTTGGIGGLFEKMFHFFQFKQEEYMACYHKRSNVESVFSAVKRKFGDAVRSRCDVAMKSEVLCKLLCHNLTCLIHEQEELGIAPMFFKDEETAQTQTIAQ